MRLWRGALERRRLPFTLVSGDWATREAAALAAIRKIL
jgi:hypothetical protein